ncbi:MAG: myo-inosose-2 dehydratase [Hyphomicrobiaceae bacterium]
MAIRIGANPIGWSNDDLRSLGGETPLETCLAEAKQAGFAGMELGHKFPREPKALKAVLDRHGLDLVSGWYSMALLEHDVDAEWAVIQEHKNLLQALGARVLIVAETSNAIHGDRSMPLSRRPHMTERQWPLFTDRLGRLAQRLRNEGMQLVYHHHMGTVIESGEEVHRLMDMTPEPMHLLLDTGHLTFAGADPAEFASIYRDRISHVHAKDVRLTVMGDVKARDKSFLDAVVDGVYTVPGDGMVDYDSVFACLEGYDGWVVVEAEQDPAKANPLTYAKLGYDNLSRFLRDAKLI